MSIWNKILIGFVFLAAVAFSYFAIRTLKTHAHWRSLAQVLELFDQREDYIRFTHLHGGRKLEVGGDPQSEAKLRELQQFFRDRDYNGLNVQPGMDWQSFMSEVSKAVAATDAVDVALVDACLSMERAPARPDAGPEEEAEGRTRGIKRLRLALHKIYLVRGRVWENCDPEQADAQTGQVLVDTDLPVPHGITPKMVLYVFEESAGQREAEYLGEFKVTDVADVDKGPVQLEPTMEMTPEELQRLSKSSGPWILYEKMPVDRHKLFADFDEDQLRQMLPESSIQDYIKHGEPATWADVAEWDVQGKVVDEQGKPLTDADGQPIEGVQGTFERLLRDYAQIFQNSVARRVEYVDLIAAATRDKQYIETALADARKHEQFRRKQLEEVNNELAVYVRERKAVTDHERALKAKVAAVNQAVEQLLAANKATAGRIAKIQLEAARRIDARTPPVTPAAGQ